MASSTRAKFTVSDVSKSGDSENVSLSPVTDEGIPENKTFWESTPNGSLKMTITNQAVHGFFRKGKSYYLDITEAS